MKTLYFLVLTLSAVYAYSQGPDPSHVIKYDDSIRFFDLARLWRADSILLEDDGTKAEFPEPLGYIGENFQRFGIHFLSVVKDPHNRYVYLVTGKTKVRGNICSFKGTMTIVSARLYKGTWDRRYREGSVTAVVKLYEDSLQKSSGVITGEMKTDFCLDKKNRIFYDALLAVADDYCNNQCVAVWKGYHSEAGKKCCWGDYRIPESRGLDVGAGTFVVSDEYKRFGWEEEDSVWWQ